jgi:hypothetical protein
LNCFGIGDRSAAEFLNNHKQQILYGKAGVAAGYRITDRDRRPRSFLRARMAMESAVRSSRIPRGKRYASLRNFYFPAVSELALGLRPQSFAIALVPWMTPEVGTGGTRFGASVRQPCCLSCSSSKREKR